MLIFLIAASLALLLYSLILMILGPSASGKDLLKGRLQRLSAAGQPERPGRPELDRPFFQRVLMPLVRSLSERLTALLPSRSGKNKGYETQKLMLQQAAWTISVEEYSTLQLVLMIGSGLLGLMLGLLQRRPFLHTAGFTLGGMFTAYTILRYVLAAAGTRRKAAMEQQLPDMLDLLSVSVAAGLAFEKAMLHLVETMDGPLVDEFAVACREMTMGRSRKDALTLLARRCGLDDLNSVVGALVQAGQLGIPIRNVLQSQSAALRRARRQRAEEQAAKLSTKMLLPMVGFIFPVLLIVLMGPSIITIMEQFK